VRGVFYRCDSFRCDWNLLGAAVRIAGLAKFRPSSGAVQRIEAESIEAAS